jgi:hypothetical protein
MTRPKSSTKRNTSAARASRNSSAEPEEPAPPPPSKTRKRTTRVTQPSGIEAEKVDTMQNRAIAQAKQKPHEEPTREVVASHQRMNQTSFGSEKMDGSSVSKMLASIRESHRPQPKRKGLQQTMKVNQRDDTVSEDDTEEIAAALMLMPRQASQTKAVRFHRDVALEDIEEVEEVESEEEEWANDGERGEHSIFLCNGDR